MSSGSQHELPSPPTDAISSLQYAPNSSKLLVSSWDKHIYVYDTTSPSSATLTNTISHRAPVLTACWGPDENTIYSGGLDWDVRSINLSISSQTVLSTHSAGIKSLVYSPETQLLISASWDCTLHIHHPLNPDAVPSTIDLPAKPFSLAISSTKLIVAMSQRLVHIYELPALALLSSQAAQDPPNTIDLEPYQRRESSLKFMTRALACMPNNEGYATSSIEGRVAVEWFDASAESQARKYAFKCHRQAADDGSGTDVVYPVHALAFHPQQGTFVSGGGDGVVALWDAIAKRRIRQYQRFPCSVAALGFSGDGRQLAVGVSPGFEEGKEEEVGGGGVKVFVRVLGEGEAKGKAAK